MGKPENVVGKGFNLHPERINKKGRPPKFTSALKAEGYSMSQIIDAITVLLSMSIEDLKIIMKTGMYDQKEVTALEQTVASAICKDKARGEIITIDRLLTRSFGAPRQSIDHHLQQKQDIDYSKYTDDELEQLEILLDKGRISEETPS
jgi:hypothetical protein